MSKQSDLEALAKQYEQEHGPFETAYREGKSTGHSEAAQAIRAILSRSEPGEHPPDSGLREAFRLMKQATYQGHASHWDSTGEHGSGCPACIEAREKRDKAQAMWDAALTHPAIEDRSHEIAFTDDEPAQTQGDE